MNSLTSTAPAVSSFAPAQPVARPEVKAPAPVAIRRRPWSKILGAAAIIFVIGIGTGAAVYYTAGYETTDDAFLEGHVHPVSPRINGTVLQVLVDDNAQVKAGDPLVQIDPADLNLAVEGASADVAQARAGAIQVTAQIARAQAEIDAATARIAQNGAILNRAQLDFNRTELLSRENARAISTQDLDAARATLESAQATRQSLLAERAAAQAGLAAAQAQSAVSQAQIDRTEAVLRTAQLQVNYTIIRSPIAGRVAKKSVEVGQRLQPGQPILAIVNDQVWVVANFKENQLAELRPGQKVRVTVDAIDSQKFAGIVESFSPGTGSKFSLLPPDNSTGNFTKVVQRVPVKILLSPEALNAAAGRLAPGLSVIAKVSIRD